MVQCCPAYSAFRVCPVCECFGVLLAEHLSVRNAKELSGKNNATNPLCLNAVVWRMRTGGGCSAFFRVAGIPTIQQAPLEAFHSH